jgi:hypothetical protein
MYWNIERNLINFYVSYVFIYQLKVNKNGKMIHESKEKTITCFKNLILEGGVF